MTDSVILSITIVVMGSDSDGINAEELVTDEEYALGSITIGTDVVGKVLVRGVEFVLEGTITVADS